MSYKEKLKRSDNSLCHLDKDWLNIHPLVSTRKGPFLTHFPTTHSHLPHTVNKINWPISPNTDFDTNNFMHIAQNISFPFFIIYFYFPSAVT